MSDIVLYIQDENDFYQAWENVFRDEVPDYQNEEDGERYKVSQTTWIDQLPSVLTFQMQRQAYMDKVLVKKQHKHPILPEIYPDRFMYQNRAVVENLRKNVDTLRKKIAYLKECLEQYHDFNGSKIGIQNALTQVHHFFSAQGQGSVPATTLTPEEMSDIKPLLPLRQEQKAEFSIVQQMLKSYGTQVQDQIQNLKNQIANQEKLLASQYSNLQNMKYHLHGVVIHDGTAESGHYYTYIKDHVQNKWRCYNDHRVTVVEEQQVLEEAMGGGMTKSAYYITYVSEVELRSTSRIDHNVFNPNSVDFERTHPYGQLTKHNIVEKIKQDNRTMMTAIDEYKGNEIAKKVTTCYEKNYEEI